MNIFTWIYRKVRNYHLSLLLGFIIGLGIHIAYDGFIHSARKTRTHYGKPLPSMIENRTFQTTHQNETYKIENSNVADVLAEKIRILCLVLTHPKTHFKAKQIKATWGKRCTILLLMSTKEDKSIPTIGLPVEEGYVNLWGKTKESFKYAYTHYLDQADWFLKTDDDSYVVVENLRYYLSNFNSSDPLYFGYRFKSHSSVLGQGYMAGVAYGLSKSALIKFNTEALPRPDLCSNYSQGAEDIEMGLCLEHVGVRVLNTMDSKKRVRFFPLPVQDALTYRPFYSWMTNKMYYEMHPGPDSCSDKAIAFHYTTTQDMNIFEYCLYQLRPFGIAYQYE